jgi:hypothetical protein
MEKILTRGISYIKGKLDSGYQTQSFNSIIVLTHNTINPAWATRAVDCLQDKLISRATIR